MVAVGSWGKGYRPSSNTHGYRGSAAPPRPSSKNSSYGRPSSNGASAKGSSRCWPEEASVNFDAVPPEDDFSSGGRALDEEEEVEDDGDDAEDVPEHLKEAVEGSLKLKRALKQEANHGMRKRRKLEAGTKTLSAEDADKVTQLLRRYRLERDVASRYVLSSLQSSGLDRLLASKWLGPEGNNQKKSVAELIADYALDTKERMGIHGGVCDAVSAYKFRWQLNEEEYQLLRGLNHKDLRYSLREYDGTRPMGEIVEEANASMPEGTSASDAAPYKPGMSTLSRFMRLELIDPFADALVCGDANLSFALGLAQHRKVLGHVGRIVSTTFEPIEILKERYKEIEDTIEQLEEHHAEVWHEVDCTRLAIDVRFRGHEDTFGAVYYNYPHAGAVRGFFDAHPFVRWRHENLMHLFFRALRAFVKPGGQVRVASNANATGVRYSDIIGAAAVNEFAHTETFPFCEWQLKCYHRSYGDKRDSLQRPGEETGYRSQNSDKDMVYSFCYAPTGDALLEAPIKMPPSCADLMESTNVCGCGFICQYSMTKCERNAHHFKPHGHHRQADDAKKEETIRALYDRFLSEINGIHIG